MSRESILSRIRSALESADEMPARENAKYRTCGVLSAEDKVRLFAERLREYDARVFHSSEARLGGEIAEILLVSGKRRMVVPPEIPAEWMDASVAWVTDRGLPYSEIDRCDGVLTGATAAVAESGSIVLQHGPAEGRRVLTLVPDYHLCVVRETQIVETLPECFTKLQTKAAAPTTFISGPSATADIEMTRIKGVHGPRFLDVVLVG